MSKYLLVLLLAVIAGCSGKDPANDAKQSAASAASEAMELSRRIEMPSVPSSETRTKTRESAEPLPQTPEIAVEHFTLPSHGKPPYTMPPRDEGKFDTWDDFKAWKLIRAIWNDGSNHWQFKVGQQNSLVLAPIPGKVEFTTGDIVNFETETTPGPNVGVPLNRRIVALEEEGNACVVVTLFMDSTSYGCRSHGLDKDGRWLGAFVSGDDVIQEVGKPRTRDWGAPTPSIILTPPPIWIEGVRDSLPGTTIPMVVKDKDELLLRTEVKAFKCVGVRQWKGKSLPVFRLYTESDWYNDFSRWKGSDSKQKSE